MMTSGLKKPRSTGALLPDKLEGGRKKIEARKNTSTKKEKEKKRKIKNSYETEHCHLKTQLSVLECGLNAALLA